MKNLPETDEEAQAVAAEAVAQGTTLISDHLASHMRQNPDSSFVTWIATLHPENASVSIDPRFLVPGNPWWTLYEDFKSDIPTATAVYIDENSQHDSQVSTITNPPSQTKVNAEPDATPFCRRCNPLECIFGASLSFAAILTVAILELVGNCMYLISAAFFHMATCLSPPNVFTGCLYSVFFLVYWILALTDSILLLSSVLVTEALAGSCFIISLLLGGHKVACDRHQFIRRHCHLLRWAFRAGLSNPPRHLVCTKNEFEDHQVAHDDAQHHRHHRHGHHHNGEATMASVVIPSAPPSDNHQQHVGRPAQHPPPPHGEAIAASVVTPSAPPSADDKNNVDDHQVFVVSMDEPTPHQGMTQAGSTTSSARSLS